MVPSEAWTSYRLHVAGLTPRVGREAEVERALLGRHDHYHCWRKGETPAGWHFGRNPRIPPIVCQADDGWRVWMHRWPSQAALRGEHGFAPESPGMRAAFVAAGPSFRSGTRLPAFDNVNIYALLAHLLQITPAANAATYSVLPPCNHLVIVCRRSRVRVGEMWRRTIRSLLDFLENRHPPTPDWPVAIPV